MSYEHGVNFLIYQSFIIFDEVHSLRMDCFLDGVKYADRVEMNTSNKRTFFGKIANGLRSTAKRMCGTREEHFTKDDHVELVRLVDNLKKPFINDHQNDNNVYQLVMATFSDLTIEDQADRIPEYINIVEGDASKVNGKVITSSYNKLGTTKSPYISSKHEFGITKLRDKSNANKDLTTWYTYRGYLSEYVDFINGISCKIYNGTQVSQQTLAALLAAFPSAPSPVLGSMRLPRTPRGRPASSGGRRTKRSKHHRRTKRAKHANRSKQTCRRKH